MSKSGPPMERLREVLSYEPETGYFKWRVKRGGFAIPGAVAGGIDSSGYVQIKIDRKMYLAHRLAWFYIHGEWPSETIDHINRIPTDNRLENLRKATLSQQRGNSHGSLRNGLPKGVDRWLGKYRARLGHNGKVKCLGYFDDVASAQAAYEAAAKAKYGEFFYHGDRAHG